MTEAYDGRQVVGVDLHRRRSVLVRMTADGRRLETAVASHRKWRFLIRSDAYLALAPFR
jgi:hypothetical protein